MAKEIRIIKRSEALLLSQTPDVIVKNITKRINAHITGLSTEELNTAIYIPMGHTKMNDSIKKRVTELLIEAGWEPSIKDDKKPVYIILKEPPSKK